MKRVTERTAIVAGSGELPLHLALTLAAGGTDLYMAALKGIADGGVESGEWETGWYDVGRLRELLDGLRSYNVTSLLLAGKVRQETVLGGERFDPLLDRLLASLPDLRGGTILNGLVGLFSEHGFRVRTIPELAPEMVAAEGRIAGPEASPEQMDDIAFGWPIAKTVADLDIGQTIVVRKRNVVGVEGLEGTDRTIRRCGELLRNSGCTVIKVSGREHDLRYDIPTVGPETVKALVDAGGGILAVEAGRCLILKREEVTSLCRLQGVALVAFSPEDPTGKE